MVKLKFLLLAAALMAQQPFFSMVSQWQPQIICAHRGATDSAELENSLTVIAKTFQAGIPMVEVDLAESKDKTIYLLHDLTLNRTTNASGKIQDFTNAQLATVSLVNPLTRQAVEPLPTFRELLQWDTQSHAKILVDIKDTPPEDAVRLIRTYGVLPNVVILTFDRSTAKLAYAADPNVTVSVLVHSSAEIDRNIRDSMGHPVALYVSQGSAPDVFTHAQATGKLVISDVLGPLDETAYSEQADKHSSGGMAVYEQYLRNHPVSIVVTNHPLLLAGKNSTN